MWKCLVLPQTAQIHEVSGNVFTLTENDVDIFFSFRVTTQRLLLLMEHLSLCLANSIRTLIMIDFICVGVCVYNYVSLFHCTSKGETLQRSSEEGLSDRRPTQNWSCQCKYSNMSSMCDFPGCPQLSRAVFLALALGTYRGPCPSPGHLPGPSPSLGANVLWLSHPIPSGIEVRCGDCLLHNGDVGMLMIPCGLCCHY